MSNVIRKSDTVTGLPVTDWVHRWRESPQTPNPDAIRVVAETIVTDISTGRRQDGSGRFRPSMIGHMCARKQVLSYLGFPAAKGRLDHSEMADTGSWLHYKWQYEGLAAGWLHDIEVQVEIPEWELFGAVDGICIDGSVFELKTMGTARFDGFKGKPVSKWQNPVPEHVRQVHAYMAALGATKASIVYVDRDSNRFREFRVLFDRELFAEMDRVVVSMKQSIKDRVLPSMLNECAEAAATEVFGGKLPFHYAYCGYRHTCVDADPWKELT